MSQGIATLPTPQEELQARLADPKTVASLNRLLDRLDVIASSVEMMDGFLRRSPEIAENVSESVAGLREMDGAGFVAKLPAMARAGAKVAEVADSAAFDRLLHSGLLDKLSASGTIEGLTLLIDKLPMLVFAVQAVEGFLQRGDVVANSIAESVADLRKLQTPELSSAVDHLPQIANAGVQLAELAQTSEFKNLLSLVKDLGNPETVAKTRQLLDKLDLAVFAMNAIDGFLRRGDEVAVSVSEGLADVRKLASSVDTEELARIASELPKLTDAGHKLIASGLLERMTELSEAGMVLVNAGIFAPQVVKPLGEVGRMATEAYAAAKTTPPKQYGIFDLMRVLKDPETQKTVHLLVEMSKQFGRRMG